MERARALAVLGIEHVVVLTQCPWTRDRVDVLVDAAAALRSLEIHR